MDIQAHDIHSHMRHVGPGLQAAHAHASLRQPGSLHTSAPDGTPATYQSNHANSHTLGNGSALHEEHASSARRTASQSKGLARWLSKLPRFRVLGLEPSGELLAIGMVYFVQGILGLSDLASEFFFKDTLHQDPAATALLLGLSGLPWVVKPLYGFISDSIPLWGYRRRSYLVLSGLVGALSWAILAAFVTTPWGAAATLIGASLATAFSDVVVDSIVVERSRDAPSATAGSLQSLCWGSNAVGRIVTAYWSGSFVDTYGTRFVFGLTAFFPLVVCLTAFLINEKRVTCNHKLDYAAVHHDEEEVDPTVIGTASPPPPTPKLLLRLRSQAIALWQALRQRDILLPTVFIFLWQATPSSSTAMFYFLTNQLGFTPEFLGEVQLAAAIAALVGVGLYNAFLKRFPVRRMLLWGTLLGALLGSSQLVLVSGLNRRLGLSDQLFALGDDVILTVLGNMFFMPVLVLAARICPPGVEATLFATLMSVSNAGGGVGTALGAALTAALGVTSSDFSRLFLLVLLCSASSLLPLPFLGLLPASLDQGEGEVQGGEGGGGEGGRAAGGSHEVEMVSEGVAETQALLHKGNGEHRDSLGQP